jgi:hypothetical protein
MIIHQIMPTNIPPGTANVFQLSEPETYHCCVWEYKKGHSFLTIVLYRDEFSLDLAITFDSVVYFSGPMMGWDSANFKTFAQEEGIELTRQLYSYGQLIEKGHKPVWGVTVENTSPPVKIVAHMASLVTDWYQPT